jgi:hypothetical protein
MFTGLGCNGTKAFLELPYNRYFFAWAKFWSNNNADAG